jgi:hypothetical protein
MATTVMQLTIEIAKAQTTYATSRSYFGVSSLLEMGRNGHRNRKLHPKIGTMIEVTERRTCSRVPADQSQSPLEVSDS